MATFRKYGGTNFSPISNIVRHNILNSKSSSFNTSGLYNSKETYLSHIDMSGNSLLHVGNIIFQDGTSISSSTDSNNGLAKVLGDGPSADGKSMTNVGSIGYVGGTTQSSAYTGWTPLINTSYNSATLTFDINGKITNVIDNSYSPYGLEDVLTENDDGGGKNMINLGDITQSDTTGSNTLKATKFNGNITQADTKTIVQFGTTGSNTFRDTSFEGNITQADTKTIVQFGTTGSNTFRDTSFEGNITQADTKTIVQFGTTGSNTFRDTSFGGNITQADTKTIVQFGTTGSNTFRDTSFGGNITQADNKTIVQFGTTGSNTLKATTFNGDITQENDNIISQSGTSSNTLKETKFNGSITQSGGGSNILNDTSFNGLCRYISGVSIIDDNDIPNKAYVDTYASGLNPVAFCDCATTVNISLTTASLKVDGYDVQDGNRVLVKSQGASTSNQNTNHVENGIYTYNSSTGVLLRASDCDAGENITNQYSFIENGTLNGLKAFIQTNSIPIFNPGTNSLLYAPFYSANFQLGNGLEFVSGTPTTLQVKQNLNFLTSVKINNSGGTSNYPLRITSSDVSKVLHLIDITTTGDFNGIITAGDNGIITYKPLSIAHHGKGDITSGIRIDISNVRLQASTSNYYDLSLSTGHNFYGNATNIFGTTTSLNAITTNFNSINNYFYNNITMNSSISVNRQISTSYLNMYDICHNPNKSTQIYQGLDQLLFDNNSSDTDPNFSNSFGFYCNKLGDSNNQTNPLSFNSSIFTVDMSNNAGGSLVRYQACNNTNYGLSIGHNFTGNCYIDGKLIAKSRAYQELNTSIYSNAVNGYYGLAKDAYPALNPYSSGVKAVSTWTQRATIQANWVSVCWSPELMLFVAVNNSTTNAAVSSNGINWSSKSVPYSIWSSVCWSPELGIFVAVAFDSKTMMSSNGSTWTSTSIFGEWCSVCWSPELGIFVAVAFNGKTMISSDGSAWTSTSISGEWYSVCWSAELGIFVAVAFNGKTMMSSNGSIWTSTSISGVWSSVCWSPELGIFVAVSNNGFFQTSSLKGRPPTSYNIFDSSFNSIDENGYWNLNYIMKNSYEYYNNTGTTTIQIVNYSFQYASNTNGIVSYELNGNNSNNYYKQGQQIIISNNSPQTYTIKCNNPSTGKNVIKYLGVEYSGSNTINLPSSKCALLICVYSSPLDATLIIWNLNIF
jgi:hypothetical protein